jgi:hypothetical protein
MYILPSIIAAAISVLGVGIGEPKVQPCSCVEDLIVDVPKDSTSVEKISKNPNPKVPDKTKIILFI